MYDMAVLTNKPLAMTEVILSGLSLSGIFQRGARGDSFENKKPHPQGLLHILRQAGVEVPEVIYGRGLPTMSWRGGRPGPVTCGVTYGLGASSFSEYRPTSPSTGSRTCSPSSVPHDAHIANPTSGGGNGAAPFPMHRKPLPVKPLLVFVAVVAAIRLSLETFPRSSSPHRRSPPRCSCTPPSPGTCGAGSPPGPVSPTFPGA